MFVKPFRYERADSFADAAGMLRDGAGSAKVLAGGQSILPMMNLGVLDLEALIDVTHVADARGIARDDGYLAIGSLTTHAELVRDPTVAASQPLLAAAAGWIGSARIRGRGTLGGSLAHSDPAAELPLAMVVAGATYDLTDGASTRSVAATDFHESYFTTSLGEDELLERVQVPVLGPGWGWGFAEVSRRRGDFALCAAAALVRVADGQIVESRFGLAGVAERPKRFGADADAIAGRIGPIDGLDPVSDVSATGDHRRHLARVLAVRALTDAFRRGMAA